MMGARWIRLAVGLLVCGVLTTAWANDNDVARDALREGRFEAVLSVTKRVAIQEPGSAINWYRMAIAATRTGDFALGALALSNAKLHDSSLSFASSPARVATLEAEISAAASDLSLASEEQSRVELLRTLKIDEPPTRIDPVPETAPVRTVQMDPPIQAAAPEVTFPLVSILAIALLIATSALLMVVARMVREHGRQFAAAEIARREEAMLIARNVAQLPLSRLIAFSRHHTILLRQRLIDHDRGGSALFQALGHYLPVLEAEAVRADVIEDIRSILDGSALSDDMIAMEDARPVLGVDSAQSVHTSVLRRAFSRLLPVGREAQP